MLRLAKNKKRLNSVEAYACMCAFATCTCTCNCSCSCSNGNPSAARYGDTSGTYSGTSVNRLYSTNPAEVISGT